MTKLAGWRIERGKSRATVMLFDDSMELVVEKSGSPLHGEAYVAFVNGGRIASRSTELFARQAAMEHALRIIRIAERDILDEIHRMFGDRT